MTLLAAQFEDPERARVIYLAAGGLVLVALFVIVGTVWWWRSAAVEHPALAPLEVMGTKSWWKGDHGDRRSRLDSVRPDGAEPGDTSLIVPDPVDLLETDRTRPLDFDDLWEDQAEAEAEAEDDGPAADEPPESARNVVRDIRPDIRRDPPKPSRAQVPMDPLLRSNEDY